MEDLTNEIKRILELPLEKVDIDKAALLLLRINRNKIMYSNLIRRRSVEKVLYELRKHYDFRMQNEALKNTAQMEFQVAEVVKKIPELNSSKATEEKVEKGRRQDHDSLPEEIQAYYLENFNILRRMRKLHEQLKLMNDDRPCDRYPYLCELLDLDTQLRGNWHYYDSYVIGTPVVKKETNFENEKVPETANPKKVSAARKYLSDNKKKISTLESPEREELIAKMQTRLDYLISSEAGISDTQMNEFKEIGLNV